MTVRQVRTFQTADGKLFRCERDAAVHDLALHMRELLLKDLGDVPEWALNFCEMIAARADELGPSIALITKASRRQVG